jgi:hypothetical protein
MWATVLDWVEEHLGQPVRVALTAAEDNGFTSATVVTSGVLRRSDGEWAVIEPPPGDVLACTVGDGGLLLFEGTIEDAERTGPHLLVTMNGGDSLAISPLS